MKFQKQLPSVHARQHQVPAQYWFDPLHEGKHGRTLREHGPPETDSCHPPYWKNSWGIDQLGKYPVCGLVFLCPTLVVLMPFWFGAVPQFHCVWQQRAWYLDMKNRHIVMKYAKQIFLMARCFFFGFTTVLAFLFELRRRSMDSATAQWSSGSSNDFLQQKGGDPWSADCFTVKKVTGGVSQSAQRPIMAFGHVQTRDQICSKLVEVLLGSLHCQAAPNHQDVAAVTGNWCAKIFPGLSETMCSSCVSENPGYGSKCWGHHLEVF